MVILVTGHSGFVGRHVLPKLLNEGHTLVCYGRNPPAAHLACHFIKGDIYTRDGFEYIPWSDLEGVLHLASAGVKASSRHDDECSKVNVSGLIGLLAALRKYALKLNKIIITPTFYEKCIEQQPSLLSNPYIATKHKATQVFKDWAQGFSGQSTLATLFQVYGKGDDSGNVLSYVAKALREQGSATLGSGAGLRDWIYVEDVADALTFLFRNSSVAGMRVHDIGSGELFSVRHMAEGIARELSQPLTNLCFDPTRDRSDVGLACKAVLSLEGWAPRISIEEGIRNLIKL
jgi:nucleoside-diphosphate-sugar epimerase